MTIYEAIELQQKADDLARELQAEGRAKDAQLVRELRQGFYRAWNQLERISEFASKGI